MGIKSSGYLLLTGSALFFILSMYAIVFSKLLPPIHLEVLKAISDDKYYCLLMVLAIPVMIVFGFLNWFGLKAFRHN